MKSAAEDVVVHRSNSSASAPNHCSRTPGGTLLVTGKAFCRIPFHVASSTVVAGAAVWSSLGAISGPAPQVRHFLVRCAKIRHRGHNRRFDDCSQVVRTAGSERVGKCVLVTWLTTDVRVAQGLCPHCRGQ